MPLELNALRMAIAEWEAAHGEEREVKRKAVLRLVTVGLIRTLMAAYDDVTEQLEQCRDDRGQGPYLDDTGD